MDELKDILKNIGDNRENPFTVPDGYFDEFPSKIQERISSVKGESKLARFFTLLKPQLALSLSILAFAIISYSVINFIDVRTKSSNKTEDIATIINVDELEFNEQDFLKIMFDEENNIPVEKIDEEAEIYMKYLMNEDIDYGTLLDEL